MENWDKSNRRYTKSCLLTNTILSFNITVTNIFQYIKKKNIVRISSVFLKVQYCMSTNPWYSKSFKCYDKTY